MAGASRLVVGSDDAGSEHEEVLRADLTLAEVGHAERRCLLGEDDAVAVAKTAAAPCNGPLPLLCLGETDQPTSDQGAEPAAAAASAESRSTLRAAPAGSTPPAYEPVWAIGAPRPAPLEHVGEVTSLLTQALETLPGRAGSTVIHGGSAGPGLLAELAGVVDSIFLGRCAQDSQAFLAVVDEAAALVEQATEEMVR